MTDAWGAADGRAGVAPATPAPHSAIATTSEDAELDADSTHRGQARLAYRLAAAHRSRLMHVHGLGWLVYDGRRWVEDKREEAKLAVLETLRKALSDSLHDHDLRRDVRKAESASGVAGILDLAKPMLAATIEDLDADPWLLNCANGTLDLRTRALRPHDPADRLTRVTTGAYRPDADAAVWEAFLAQVLPSADVRGYLQRVVGQAVYGRVREHLFPVLTGTGANGKSTAYTAITSALGDYAKVIDPELLMARERGRTGGPELMVLLGARLVVGSETAEGRKLDEAVMKRLTGGDELTARNLYSPPVTWVPSHQLLYVTNALPTVRGNDPAVWRRVRVIPFDVTVPPEQRDPDLPETLRLHADAILGWVIAGHFDYENNGGMREPASVVAATDGYRTESDAVARFVADACELNPNFHATTRELFGVWTGWAVRDGAEPLTEKAFSGELVRLGYESKRTNSGKTWKGLRPIPDQPEIGGGDGW
ncbi:MULTISPECIES: phage/plasmid primase, P4 family [unclassified Aeromicrobium]|uniref:DNA primase family protein n=1 Tax=unclassified Aeromicrobium TaxID=2633570 RepID=UPI00396B17C2